MTNKIFQLILIAGALIITAYAQTNNSSQMKNLDPIQKIKDSKILVNNEMLQKLKLFLDTEKFKRLPGTDNSQEKIRLTNGINSLTTKLMQELTENPSKLWVMKQFQISLKDIQNEDTEGREHFGYELENLMDILNIQSSDGLLAYYLNPF